MALLLALTIAVAIALSLVPRFSQPLSYHDFADQRSFLGIPRFADVISNLPFALVGLWGMIFILRTGHRSVVPFLDARERWPYLVAFVGIFLTAFGSAYYHLDPNNARLVWDRLPIMIAFTATAAAMITERVSILVGRVLLPVLLALGISGVIQWYASEQRGIGDLRFYAAMQVGVTLVLLLVLLFPARYTRGSDLGIVVGLYALAKVFELFDKPVFHATRWISGHTVKHLAAAAAGYWLLRMLQKRKVILHATADQG